MPSLADLPDELPRTTCTRCGEAIARGYVVATDSTAGYAFETETTVCDTCGWTDVGATGCAPTLSEFGTGDLLVRVERADGSLGPAAITDDGA